MEFAAKNFLESSNEESEDYENLDIESLSALVEKKRNQLAVLSRHQAEKEEMTNLISRWKQAGLDAIERLREFVQPPKTDEEIVDSFNISRELFL